MRAFLPSSALGRRISRFCRNLRASRRFQLLSMTVIMINGAALGAMTFPDVEGSAGRTLEVIDGACLGFFTLEVLIGLAAFGSRPWRYFRHGWNVFDFLIVVAALLPGVRENATILRLLRLARIARLFRSMPSLSIILVTVGRALPKSAGLFALTGVVMYLWAMIGWVLFRDVHPEGFGTVGNAVFNLFILITLEDMGDILGAGMEASMWTLPYYLVFVLFGGFILLNVLIGVVLASMEEARRLDDEDGIASADTVVILDRLENLQAAVDRLSRTGPEPPEQTRREMNSS